MINKRLIWHEHILRIKDNRTPKKVLNTKWKGKCQRERPRTSFEHQVKTDTVSQKTEVRRHQKKTVEDRVSGRCVVR